MLSEGYRGGRVEGRGIKVPRFARRNRHVHNKPDVPGVEKVSLPGLTRFVPDGAKTAPRNGGSRERTQKKTKFGNGKDLTERNTNGTVYKEVAKTPLTPIFRAPFGGGRPYGGGTSKEAIRRAKKKKKKEKSKRR